MIVDFEEKELRFRINHVDYGKVGDLRFGYKYRAAVTLWDIGDAVQLL